MLRKFWRLTDHLQNWRQLKILYYFSFCATEITHLKISLSNDYHSEHLGDFPEGGKEPKTSNNLEEFKPWSKLIPRYNDSLSETNYFKLPLIQRLVVWLLLVFIILVLVIIIIIIVINIKCFFFFLIKQIYLSWKRVTLIGRCKGITTYRPLPKLIQTNSRKYHQSSYWIGKKNSEFGYQ